MAMHVWIRCEMQFMDIVESHCYVVDNWQIYLEHTHSKHSQSINQFCTQLTKAYMAERSCSQMLLIEFAIYVCMLKINSLATIC